MTSSEVRAAAKALCVPLWKIAKKIGIHEQTFLYWLHDDTIPETRETRIKRALDELRQQNA